jgi:outer membrane immunogenic protein
MKFAAVAGGIALACLASLPGRAADVTLAPQPAIKAAPGYFPAYFWWTGFYFGATLGGGFGHETFSDPFSGQVGSISLSSFLAGGYTGINYQIGSLVIGVEGDFIGSWSRGSTGDPFGDTLSSRVFWTSSITPRVGWAFDRVLVYGKGGGGFAFHTDKVTGPLITGVPLGSAISVGWTVGGGVEWAVTEHWIARAEYDYFRFPNKGEFVSGGITINPITLAPTCAGSCSGSVIGFNFNEAKVGMAWKF